MGPSSRVRVFEWLRRVTTPHVLSSYISERNAAPTTLAQHPIAVVAAERRLRQMAARRPTRFLLHREASPLSRGGLERKLLTSSEFAVYDFDDALQWDWGEGGLFRRIAPKAPKALVAVQHADRVIAGNPILAGWASQHADDVVVIPSCVSPDSYRVKTDYEIREPPRLVWVGSADNERYLAVAASALSELHRRTGARLTIISSPKPSLGELERFIDRLPWSEAAQHEGLADFDLAVGPLPDEPYTRGKCGYKLLQYAAAGVPIVASPVGVNEEMLSEMRMPAPTDEGEWLDAMLDLLTRSVPARAELGRDARDVVQRLYSYEAWLPRWEQAVGIADLVEAGPKRPDP
jgi:glycosyltransferase involved in cell wall biosynthesis